MKDVKAKRAARIADTKKAKDKKRVIKKIKSDQRVVSYSKIGVNITEEEEK